MAQPIPVLLLSLSILSACSREPEKTSAWTGKVKSGRPMERAQAALELWNSTSEVEPGLRVLLDDAASSDPQRRRAAAACLPRAKAIPETVIDWVIRTRHGHAALVTLGAIGPAAKRGLPTVRAALKEPDPSIRLTAIWALYRIAGEPDEPVSLLLAELVHANAGLRRMCADQLLDIGSKHPKRFEELLGAAGTPAAKELLALHRKRQK